MLRLAVSIYEQAILEDIEEVGYGELFNVGKGEDVPEKMVDVSERAFHFVKQLRKLAKFDKVTIHDSEPTIAEYRTVTKNMRPCLKRIKF